MELTKTQQEVVDRYLDATKNNPESRMTIAKLLGMKSKIPRSRPDKSVLEKCEKAYLEEPIVETAGRKQRQLDNSAVQSILSDFPSYNQAVRRFYWLDDIMEGVCRLDLGGNTRDLSKAVIYNFLSTSNLVNNDIVMAACNVKERQSRNIMNAVVIANRMIEKELRRMELVV